MELEDRDGLTVAELIDMLSQHPADAIVEMSIVAPIQEGDDDITVDRYHIDGIMPWHDEDDSNDVVWLVGGEDEDVDVFGSVLVAQGHYFHKSHQVMTAHMTNCHGAPAS